MKRVFIIHGFEGKPNGGWRPWLERELADLDVTACSLPMPEPNRPVCRDWLNMMDFCIGKADKDTYLVGHSLGVPAILNYLEKSRKKIGGAVLVSGPIEIEPGFRQGKLDTFFEHVFDLKKIRNKAFDFAVIHGDDDKGVNISQGRKLSKGLSCKLIIVKNGGHLNGASGYRELPQLLKVLKGMASLKHFSGVIY